MNPARGKRIDLEEMTRIFRYDPDTGHIYWKENRKKKLVGARAGTIDQKGYVMIKLRWQGFSAARLAWMLHYGVELDPTLTIDHIDRNRSNNRIDNLRAVSQSINNINRDVRINYYSRLKNGRFQAMAMQKYLGIYKTPEEARARSLQYIKDNFPEHWKEMSTLEPTP